MSVLRSRRSSAPLVCIAFAAAVSFGACSDDTSSSDEPVTAADAGGSDQAGHSANGGTGGKGSAGKGGTGGKASAAGSGGAGGKGSAAGSGGAGGKGKAGAGGKASAAGSGGAGGKSGTTDGDAGVDLEDAGARALPQEFKISFSTTRCFGRCPVYSVSIDQDGNVEFDGQENVTKAGKSTKQVTPNAAADVYEALLAAGYFQLKDSYRTEQDGCERVRSDSPTHNWSVLHDGQTKELSQYLGCEGVAGLDKVEAASRLLIEKSAIAEWIGSNN